MWLNEHFRPTSQLSRMQGCPQDVKSQDRDETETFQKTSRDRLKTETFKTKTTSLVSELGHASLSPMDGCTTERKVIDDRCFKYSFPYAFPGSSLQIFEFLQLISF